MAADVTPVRPPARSAGHIVTRILRATHHGKPLVGGMVARYPDARLRALTAEVPVYAQVMALQSGQRSMGSRQRPLRKKSL